MPRNSNVTILGPEGSTFTHLAYLELAREYRAPRVPAEFNSVNRNNEILKGILALGGYGAIAMETFHSRVDESLDSFIKLLDFFTKTNQCPFHIIGAMKMPISFCLMGRPEVDITKIKGVIAHGQALSVCEKNLKRLGVPLITADSNGLAAEHVANNAEYKRFAALAPSVAAEKYGLQIYNEAFEDQKVATTFFLIGPRKNSIVHVGKMNRVLIVYKIPRSYKANTLIPSLLPFANEDLSLIQIYNIPAGNDGRRPAYHFAIEISVKKNQIPAFERALAEFQKSIRQAIVFGPFKVI